MSDYTPPSVVKPTPGGAAGAGSMNGSLTVQSGNTDPPSSKVFLLQYSSFDTGIFVDTSGNLNFVNTNGGKFLVFGAPGERISIETTFWYYNNIATAGLGVGAIYGAGLLTSLGTASTTVASYTPTSSTGQSFEVKWRLSCVTASTPTLTLTYTDPKAGAQTITLYNSAMSASTVASGSYPLVATSAAAITVSGKDGAAADYIYATVEILQYQ